MTGLEGRAPYWSRRAWLGPLMRFTAIVALVLCIGSIVGLLVQV